MDLNFGINGSFGIQASRLISINSSTPIGIVATADKGDVGLMKFNSAKEGLKYIEDKKITSGTLEATLKGINLQGVNCPLVCNIILKSEIRTTVQALEGDDNPPQIDKSKTTNKQVTNQNKPILDGLEKLKQADPVTGINLRNGLIIAPEYSAITEIATKLDSIASSLWATGIVDDFSSDEAGVSSFAQNFSSKYLLIGTGKYKADGKLIPFSALMAGVIAFHDANTAFGWAKSHSNRVVRGVAGTQRVIEYLDGSDCESRRLRQKGVAMILKDVGWRTYGFETTDIDPIWQSLDRVRTFHRLLASILKANKWARDREADQLIWVIKSIVEFMNELKGNGVVIGFDVFFDTEKNTKATVTAGKFYLTVLVQDMPSIRELNIELVYSDNWSETLINYINS